MSTTATAIQSAAYELPVFESVGCLACGGSSSTPFLTGEDDLTGKPGRFTFVTCSACGLVYQSPRLTLEGIRPYSGG